MEDKGTEIAALCPFCAANKGYIINYISSEKAAAYFALHWNDLNRYKNIKTHIELLWEQDKCDIVRCSSCSGLFAWPFVSGDKMFYELAFPSHRYPQNKWEYSKAIVWIKEMFNGFDLAKLTALEIGAGDGAFIKKLIHIGFKPENIDAFEYNEQNRAIIGTLRINSVLSGFISTEIKIAASSKYNIIFLFQVLEHLDDLDTFMQSVSLSLCPNGYLLLAIPNYFWVIFNEKYGQIIDVPPYHVSVFSKKSIDKLALRHNYKVVLFQAEPGLTLHAVKAFYYHQYLNDSLNNKYIASLITRIPHANCRRMFIVVYMFLMLISNINLLPQLIRLGASNLVVMKKGN